MSKRGVCGRCGKSLKTEALVAMDQLWHRDCFCCRECKKAMEHGYFPSQDNLHAFCVSCYTNKFHPKCKSCGKAASQKYVEALGNKWHKECFVCSSCSKEFPKGEYFELDGLAYDLDCYWAKRLQAHLEEMAQQQGREAKSP